jgi:hypothetical protein
MNDRAEALDFLGSHLQEHPASLLDQIRIPSTVSAVARHHRSVLSSRSLAAADDLSGARGFITSASTSRASATERTT